MYRVVNVNGVVKLVDLTGFDTCGDRLNRLDRLQQNGIQARIGQWDGRKQRRTDGVAAIDLKVSGIENGKDLSLRVKSSETST